ncbi:MFS transporter [Veillonella intestinalis]|uniref:MFS transporter n=1 Tax=Veillonella intestinalis TaxID=2941341 RepID=UPI0020412E37|nr:MFS transporter [Veillonella intestinalis]
MTSSKLVYILAIGVFGILNTEMGIIGVLPYIATQYNISLIQAGSLLSVFALGVALAGPTMPLLLSKWPRKPLMLFVLAVFTITSILAAWAPNFETLFIARLVPALLHPVYCAMAFSLAASSVAKKDAPKAVAKINMGVAAGMVIGIPISNFLTIQLGLSFAFLFSALVTALVFALTLWQIPDSLPHEQISYGEQLQVLRKVSLWLAIFFVIALNGSIYGVYNYYVWRYMFSRSGYYYFYRTAPI